MNSINASVTENVTPFLGAPEDGPVTRAKKMRTRIIYILCVVGGLLPWLLGAAPALQAASLGLLFPGAGFFAVGGWALVLVPLVLALYGISLVAWFGSGMISAPIVIWLGSAALAAALAGDATWSAGPPLALGLLVVYRVISARRQGKAHKALLKRREERLQFLPEAIREVGLRATEPPPADERELSPVELQVLRYNLDLALQPVERFEGFDTIEQFQTSALRYQLNNVGYSLSSAQAIYTPNFQGYNNLAQRNVIEKMLTKKVWGYWRWERLWGHFSTRFDPVGRDNIMLTGFFGLQVCLYMAETGDMRYAEPGSLTFKWGKHEFAHDIHSMIGSIDENYSRSEFCLFPCEPGWVYTPCNFMGMMALIAYDRLFGTALASKHMARFMRSLGDEFTLADGDLIALRSEVTGGAIPFPFGNESQPLFLNAFAPERARQAWALARDTYVKEKDGKVEISGLEKGVDFGRYRKSPLGHLMSLLGSASEMGDQPVVTEVLRLLNELGSPQVKGGVLKYDCTSTSGTSLVRGVILRKGDWRKTVTQGAEACTRKGPILTEASYPAVLVAKAFSHGEDLQLVLYPGQVEGEQTVRIERLQPGVQYSLQGAGAPASFVADAQGQAQLRIHLAGRTAVSIQPAL
ncbi:hypothetical protein PMI22_00768 [Pseudomonas sp. GM21]|uniref:linalool dehydratase/isomerase domain-containing protein n=1 Tax=Pseudomonas sp. GM21 TaxID=1144325 RepID=UPI00027258F8|nr:hypothetical protein [Pseudomonas sp. GM21]EJM24357.1 hypothetical protein PMI22_00768 [Pseudomonas sp. GM21]